MGVLWCQVWACDGYVMVGVVGVQCVDVTGLIHVYWTHVTEQAPALCIPRGVLLEHVPNEEDGVKGALRCLGDSRGHMMDVIQIVHNVEEMAEKVNNGHLGNMPICNIEVK